MECWCSKMTDEKYKFKVDKLIRDKLPNLLQKTGVTLNIRNMNQEEYITRLKDKLIEEANELLSAKTEIEMLEELADILEVLEAFCTANGIPFKKAIKAKKKKKFEKGGFDGKVYNSYVEVQPDNPKAVYFLARPDKYPRIKDIKLC